MSADDISKILEVLELVRREQSAAAGRLATLETTHAESNAANRASIGQMTLHVNRLAANVREASDQVNALEKRVIAIPELFASCKTHCLVGNAEQLRAYLASAIRDTSTNLVALPDLAK